MRKLLLLLPWLFSSIVQAAPPCGGEGPAVQVLGSGDASLAGKRAGHGALIWVGGKARVLVNAGSGVALRFRESGAQWNDLDAIVFTRIDVAHSADLPALLQFASADGRNRALPVYGPAGNKFAPATVTYVRDLFDPVRGIYRHLGNLLAPLDRSGYKLEPHDVREPQAKLTTPRRKGPTLLAMFGNERVRLKAMLASQATAPTLAWRIEVAGTGLVFGADPEMAESLIENTALLLAPIPAAAEARDAEAARRQLAGLTQQAQSARVRQLVLTGRSERAALSDEEAVSAMRKTFTGTVVLADDLACLRF